LCKKPPFKAEYYIQKNLQLSKRNYAELENLIMRREMKEIAD